MTDRPVEPGVSGDKALPNGTPRDALLVALRYLESRERFEGELRKHLNKFESSEVDLVVEYLTIKNVLNDRRTALSYLRSKEGRRAVGRFRIEQDLRSKGVTENVIAEVCDELEDGSRAKGLLASKFRPEPELKPKAFRFLVSRGFQYDAAHQAVREFFAGGVEED